MLKYMIDMNPVYDLIRKRKPLADIPSPEAVVILEWPRFDRVLDGDTFVSHQIAPYALAHGGFTPKYQLNATVRRFVQGDPHHQSSLHSEYKDGS